MLYKLSNNYFKNERDRVAFLLFCHMIKYNQMTHHNISCEKSDKIFQFSYATDTPRKIPIII
jgi:hypothetical protein